jgi:hypothetical protein
MWVFFQYFCEITELFRRKEEHSELLTFVLNHSVEDKNALDFVPNNFAEEKKHSKFQCKSFSRRNFWKLVLNHSGTRKDTQMTFKKHFFTEFHSILFISKPWNGLF